MKPGHVIRMIASFVCLIPCGLVVALWLRSVFTVDCLYKHYVTDTTHIIVWSSAGKAYVDVPWFVPPKDTGVREMLRKHLDAQTAADLQTFRKLGYKPMPATNLFGFKWWSWRAFVIPYWFPALLAATFAAVPWVYWSGRFSLRTLLIATTLIAVVLGLVTVFGR